jgi:hypothetical protein
MDAPIVKRRFLIGMCCEQRAHRGFDAFIVANHLDADFIHRLELSDTS